MEPLRILFATPECAPWVKTGGLADVSAGLPAALEALGHDVRVLLPAYPSVLAAAAHRRAFVEVPAMAHFPACTVHQSPLPSGVPAWLLNCPELFERDGGPYQDREGVDWEDNAQRFGQLARVAALLAGASNPLDWRPDVLHCNDWQTALAPAYLRFAGGARARTVMTIHNLAFQGLFPPEEVARLGLPAESYSIDGVEFWGRMSFLKAGLQYADAITTVSPTYAREIRGEPLGFGLQGLLAARSAALHGIANGIDIEEWDPATDRLIAQRYDADRLTSKAFNKEALQERLGLPLEPRVPLVGMVSRLTLQKGIDLVVEVAREIVGLPAQLVVLGTGERELESALADVAKANAKRSAVRLGYDEPLAHLIEAGADMFLMPSRFEPCGLNQMYSQRYGTPPVARATGGLADTIVDATRATLADGTATGFLFDEESPAALLAAVERAIELYREPKEWRQLQRAGMAADFSWGPAARKYAEVYAGLVQAARR
ncbi:MAG TPA: glycogen synthase GlgA [Burkholderiales bacterium]|nr:glycogen synthase GlgA [Burkholderiales bacterium]